MFNVKRFAVNHLSRFSIIALISFLKSAILEQAKYTAVSSANILILIFSLEQFTRSFIYKMNKRGPRTEPWGTPQFINLRLDLWSFIWTYWCLFVK